MSTSESAESDWWNTANAAGAATEDICIDKFYCCGMDYFSGDCFDDFSYCCMDDYCGDYFDDLCL